ncbi:M20/M25/M40 family metallo-hydrolase, partial [bacterium]|nr:M20/M25/M40 family metallo-hydrolase [bacterium]
ILADITAPSPREEREIRKVAEVFDLEAFKRDSEQASLYSEDPVEILDGVWRKPTFEIHGFEGAQWEPGVLKSALPYHVKAKVSMRLVPGQNPDIVQQKLQTHLSNIDSRLKVHLLSGQRPAVAQLDNPFMDRAIEACKIGFGEEPLFVGCGGTIGAVPEMQRVFPNAPVVLLAQSLMSDGYHAPNEEFRLSQARNGMKTMAAYFRGVADLKI